MKIQRLDHISLDAQWAAREQVLLLEVITTTRVVLWPGPGQWVPPRVRVGDTGPSPAISPREKAVGIAAGYPGDVGLEQDPRVIFAENFEEDSLGTMWQRWETISDHAGVSFSEDIPPGSTGKRSLVMERFTGSGVQLYRRLKNKAGGWGYDHVFARYYVKFDPDCGEIHHFETCLGGSGPSTPWPVVNAGHPTDGAKSFWSGIEPFGSSWVWN